MVIIGAKLRQAEDVRRQHGAVIQYAYHVTQLASRDAAVGLRAERDANLAGAAERHLEQAAGRHRAEIIRQAIVEQPVERRIERDLEDGRHKLGGKVLVERCGNIR